HLPPALFPYTTLFRSVPGQDVVAADIQEHAFGMVGGDVAEALVVVLVVAFAQVAETVEEVAGEQADADAQLQDENVVFQRTGLGDRKSTRLNSSHLVI